MKLWHGPCGDPTCHRGAWGLGFAGGSGKYQDGPCAADDCRWVTSLERALHDVHETLGALPVGYSVTVDEPSQSILIASSHFGFAITPFAYEHGVDVTTLRDNYLRLQNMTNGSKPSD